MHAFPESSDHFLLRIEWAVVWIHATVHNANQFWGSWNYLFNLALTFSLLNFLASNNFTVFEAAPDCRPWLCTSAPQTTVTTICLNCRADLWGLLFWSRSRFSSFISFSLMVPTAAVGGWFFLFLFYKFREITKDWRFELHLPAWGMCWSLYLNPDLHSCKCPRLCSSETPPESQHTIQTSQWPTLVHFLTIKI